MNEKETEQLEKLILALSLGLCLALEKKSITLGEFEHLLYSPYVIDTLQGLGVNEKIITLIHNGTELGDVARIVPEHFGEHFESLKKDAITLLKALPSYDVTQPRWIKTYLSHSEEEDTV